MESGCLPAFQKTSLSNFCSVFELLPAPPDGGGGKPGSTVICGRSGIVDFESLVDRDKVPLPLPLLAPDDEEEDDDAAAAAVAEGGPLSLSGKRAPFTLCKSREVPPLFRASCRSASDDECDSSD